MESVVAYLPLLLKGALLTVWVAVSSLIISTIIGLIGSVIILKSCSSILKGFLFSYTTLIRGVPDLVLLMLFFYGGQVVINNLTNSLGYDYIEIRPLISGIITISIIFGAYMIETFRGALQNIDQGEQKAAISIGLHPVTIFFYISLPQLARLALPGFCNNWLVLSKTTALVSLIGLQDIAFMASNAGGSTRQPFTFYTLALIFFLLLTFVSERGLKALQRLLDRPYAS